MKKVITMVLAVGLLVGCTDQPESKNDTNKADEETKVSTTVSDTNQEDNKSTESTQQLTPAEQIAAREQETYNKMFEEDMDNFNEILNNVNYQFTELAAQILDEDTSVSVETYNNALATLDEAYAYLEDMQDFSGSDKYGEVYTQFINATGYLVGAKVFMENGYEANDKDLFFEGFEKLTKSMDEFKIVGEEYAEAKNQ
ncbi:hypothetical protein [Niallia taxi]|uniref:hypothetical protein n=1 Tax=Niallia taxi TaxID=2499688 RepID=UPI00300B7BFF